MRVNIYKPLKGSVEAEVCNHTERVCLTLNQRRCYCPSEPGPLHQETSEWLLRNVLVNALNIQSKGSNISMLTLEEGRVFDNLTQLYRWMERLLPRGSPREGGESAEAWYGCTVRPCHATSYWELIRMAKKSQTGPFWVQFTTEDIHSSNAQSTQQSNLHHLNGEQNPSTCCFGSDYLPCAKKKKKVDLLGDIPFYSCPHPTQPEIKKGKETEILLKNPQGSLSFAKRNGDILDEWVEKPRQSFWPHSEPKRASGKLSWQCH